MAKNKIKYGLSNAHVYPITKDEQGGDTTYGDAIALLGSVSLSLSAESSSNPFYADNKVYYQTSSNNGYSGSLEIALIPDEFYTQILGMKKDEKTGALIESTNDKVSEFALAFQFEGDDNAIKHVLFRCKATRPNIESETQGESVDPKTDSFDFVAMARLSDNLVRAKAESDAASYGTFFEAPINMNQE